MKKSYLYAIITVLIWSTMAAAVKVMLQDIPNLQALAVSGFFAFLFLVLINAKGGRLKTLKNYTLKQYGIMAGLGFIGLFVYSALYYFGLAELTSQEACILNYLWPMMLVVFSCLILKEKLTVMKVVAMVCSFLGIVILSLGGGSSAGGNTTLGMIACVVAAACYGLFSVLNKKADLDQNITMMVIWLTVAVCSTLLGVFTETWVPIRGTAWFGLIWLGVVTDAVAYLLWALALKGTENTATVANLAYLVPFLSVVISAVFLKEKIELRAIAALVLIIGGIFLQSLFDRKREKQGRTLQK